MRIRAQLKSTINTARKIPRASKQGLRFSLFSRHSRGTHVFEKDWDVLLLLDACRVDALRELSPEYNFLEDVGSITSLGSTSSEWIAQTFSANYADELSRTAYLSNNGHSEWTLKDRNYPEDHHKFSFVPTNWDVVDASDIGYLEHVWKYSDFVDDPEYMCTSRGYDRPSD